MCPEIYNSFAVWRFLRYVVFVGTQAYACITLPMQSVVERHKEGLGERDREIERKRIDGVGREDWNGRYVGFWRFISTQTQSGILSFLWDICADGHYYYYYCLNLPL